MARHLKNRKDLLLLQQTITWNIQVQFCPKCQQCYQLVLGPIDILICSIDILGFPLLL